MPQFLIPCIAVGCKNTNGIVDTGDSTQYGTMPAYGYLCSFHATLIQEGYVIQIVNPPVIPAAAGTGTPIIPQPTVILAPAPQPTTGAFPVQPQAVNAQPAQPAQPAPGP